MLALSFTSARVNWIQVEVEQPYMSGKQRIDSKSSSLPLIICSQYYQYVFDADHQCKGPNNDGEGAEKIIMTWFGGESGGVNI